MRIRSAGSLAVLALLVTISLAAGAAASEELMDLGDASMVADAPEADATPVARAAFTTLVADREPQDDVSRLSNDHNQIIFFTDLRDLAGRSVTHVWERDGVVMARVPFAVKGPRWRVYSTKNLEPSWVGEWTVKVMDDQGKLLHSETFAYVSVAAEAPVGDSAPPASMPE